MWNLIFAGLECLGAIVIGFAMTIIPNRHWEHKALFRLGLFYLVGLAMLVKGVTSIEPFEMAIVVSALALVLGYLTHQFFYFHF